MISREEAAELLTKDYNSAIIALNAVYDSIGTCGECDRWLKHPDNDFGACWLVQLDEDNLWHKEDYCSRFERKA